MDEIEKAFEFSKYQRVLQNQREILKVKTQTLLQLGYEGGLFKASPETIVFFKTLLDAGYVNDVPVMDLNDNPILISDLQELYDNLISKYFEVFSYIRVSRFKILGTGSFCFTSGSSLLKSILGYPTDMV